MKNWKHYNNILSILYDEKEILEYLKEYKIFFSEFMIMINKLNFNKFDIKNIIENKISLKKIYFEKIVTEKGLENILLNLKVNIYDFPQEEISVRDVVNFLIKKYNFEENFIIYNISFFKYINVRDREYLGDLKIRDLIFLKIFKINKIIGNLNIVESTNIDYLPKIITKKLICSNNIDLNILKNYIDKNKIKIKGGIMSCCKDNCNCSCDNNCDCNCNGNCNCDKGCGC